MRNPAFQCHCFPTGSRLARASLRVPGHSAQSRVVLRAKAGPVKMAKSNLAARPAGEQRFDPEDDSNCTVVPSEDQIGTSDLFGDRTRTLKHAPTDYQRPYRVQCPEAAACSDPVAKQDSRLRE